MWRWSLKVRKVRKVVGELGLIGQWMNYVTHRRSQDFCLVGGHPAA